MADTIGGIYTPKIREAFDSGELPWTKAREIVSVATPETEAEWLAKACVLSNRELEVLELIGQGLGTAMIAEHLHVSPRTVETYRSRLKMKLNLESAADLNRCAVEWAMQNR